MKNFDYLKIGVIIGVVLIIVGIIYSIYYPTCLKSHKGMVHHPAWTQLVATSIKPLIIVPIFHPESDDLEDICDVRKQ